MYKAMKAEVRIGNPVSITSGKGEFKITSINAHCSDKLAALVEKTGGAAYITLEDITEYSSSSARCKISHTDSAGWNDEDVFCLVERVAKPELRPKRKKQTPHPAAPEYSILRMRDDVFICTEGLFDSYNRFRRLCVDGHDPYSTTEAISELWETKGRVKVEVVEGKKEGKVVVRKGSKSLTGEIVPLSERDKAYLRN